MKPSSAFLLALAVFTAQASAQSADYRVFTSGKGMSIKAQFVSSANGQVTIKREDGQVFTLPLATLSAADQDFVKRAPPLVTGKAAFFPKAGPGDKLTAEEINALAGQPVFAELPLFQSAPSELAARLKLKQESKTSLQSSYRSYPKADFHVFGTRPYSVALYAEADKVSSLSLVFANRGDLFSAKGSAEMHFDKDAPPAEAKKLLATAMAADVEAVTGALSAKLGPPAKARFGEGKERRNMSRWDWRGHAILLAEVPDQYVGIEIVPAAFADAGGKVARTSDAVIRERAKANVEKRPIGDVVINDIPMVDQGPKGYCVPATAERAMRYMGVPADMYVLAMAGESGYGGGTSVEYLLEAVGRDIKRKGRAFDHFSGPMKLKELAKHIDKGIPVMWALYSTKEFNKTA
ncbi:MAG: hypothetical protein JWO89_258, partial [Verrucomicrobiaceae bacterium]|nr:hypothetical protein [Verrucomicrobiaceae bacterium]